MLTVPDTPCRHDDQARVIMRRIWWLTTLVATALVLLPLFVAGVAAQPRTLSLEDRLHGPGSQPFEGFRVIDNIYYVGATGISAHIIATPAGLILLDTGTEQMLPVIRGNVAKLGFRMQDIK